MSKKHKKSKITGKAKKTAKAFLNNPYEAARSQKRLSNWFPSSESINQILFSDGKILRARARDLVRNNPYAVSAIESFVSNLIGKGVKPSLLIDDKKIVQELTALWEDWVEGADFDNLTDFYGLQALIARAMFEAGECFVRIHIEENNTSLVPLKIQLLESEMLDYSKTGSTNDGHFIVNGIEVDNTGKRIAYWFFRNYPGDFISEKTSGDLYERIPADEILHIFRPLRPGQMRGAPWVVASVLKLWQLEQFDDAELERKRKASMFSAFITTPLPAEQFFGENDIDNLGAPNRYTDLPVLEPGTIQLLDKGDDIRFAEPAEVGNSYEPFQYRNILAASAGMGVPYMNMTGDYEKANYSSARQGMIEFRARLEQLQHTCIIHQLCKPIWATFIKYAVISDAIDLPDYPEKQRLYNKVKWIPPRRDWIDPLHDLQAEKLAVDNGFKSRSDVIVASGSDPVETDKRIAADAERSKNLGIKFDDENSGLPGGQQTSRSMEPEDGDPPGTDVTDNQQNGYNSP